MPSSTSASVIVVAYRLDEGRFATHLTNRLFRCAFHQFRKNVLNAPVGALSVVSRTIICRSPVVRAWGPAAGYGD